MTSVGGTGPVVVTPASLGTSLVADLTSDQAAMASLQDEISSGQAVIVPSDDPAAAAQSLQLQATLTRANQYSTNAQTGLGWLTQAGSTVSSVLSTLQSVRSAVLGLSGTALSGGTAGVTAVTQQVSAALSQLLDLANTQYAGQAIFSGTGNVQQAYASDGTYVGAGAAPTVTVAPGTQVAMSVTGPEVFGSGTSGLLSSTPGSLGVLAQIVSDLQTGTSASLNAAQTTDLGSLDTAIAQVETQAGVLGANQQLMQSYSDQATSTTTTLEQQLGSLTNVNMAQAITNLQLQQTAYQAALYATAQLNTTSLVSYL
ncbi:MAG TPA: flagellin [Acidimicrobiales bacterium]|jgi:flagellar hook-associated protein 3 FlgL